MAVVPKLLPMEETLKDMWKRRLGFVIEMTSGVVYSIVMHSVIITAYALAIFRIFYTNGFNLDELSFVCGLIIFTYLPFGIAEVVARRFYSEEEPLIVTKVGHFAHFFGCWMLFAYLIPSNPVEGLVFFFVEATLVFWSFFCFSRLWYSCYVGRGSLNPTTGLGYLVSLIEGFISM